MKVMPILVVFSCNIAVIVGFWLGGGCGKMAGCKNRQGQQKIAASDWDDPCPRTCDTSSNKELIYHLYGGKKFGFQAVDLCHSHGGRLMTVKTTTDADKLRKIVDQFKNEPNGFWIGGVKLPYTQNPIYEDFAPLDLSTFTKVSYSTDIHDGDVACLRYDVQENNQHDFAFVPCKNFSSANAFMMLVCEFLVSTADKKCSDRCFRCADETCLFNLYDKDATFSDSKKMCTERFGRLPIFKDTKDNKKLPLCTDCSQKEYFTGNYQPTRSCFYMVRGHGIKYELADKKSIFPHVCPAFMPYVCENDYLSSAANIGNFSGQFPDNEFYYGYPYDCIPYLGSCFLFVQEKKNSTDANLHCHALGADNLEDHEEFVNTSWPYVTSFLWLTVSQSGKQQLKDDFQFVGELHQQYYGVKPASNSGSTKDVPRAFICMFILCTVEPPEPNATQNIQLANRHLRNGLLTYNCSDGFVPKNKSRPTANATCTYQGWELPSPEELTCIPSGCDEEPPTQIAAQNIQLVNPNPADGYYTYMCSDGYVPNNENKPAANATCTDKGWQPPSPKEFTCFVDDDACLSAHNNLILRLYKPLRTGFEAREFCHAKGGRLVFVTSQETAKLLLKWTSTINNTFWIGGSNIGFDGSWKTEDGTEVLKDWQPKSNDGPVNNTCLAFNKQTVPISQACNDRNVKAGIICEMDDFYRCPALITDTDKFSKRFEFYTEKFKTALDANRYCEEIGGYMARAYGVPTAQKELLRIYPPIEESMAFITRSQWKNSRCITVVTTTKGKTETNTTCNATINAGVLCGFVVAKVPQQGKLYNGRVYRVLGNAEFLRYPPDCVHYLGSCWLFVMNSSLQSTKEVRNYCENLGGRQLKLNDGMWERAAFQLTFNRSPKLVNYNAVVLPSPGKKHQCYRYQKGTWRETGIHPIDSTECKPTGLSVCEFFWCLDDPLLLTKREDVKLVDFVRKLFSVAAVKCNEEGMIFPRQRLGAVFNAKCSYETGYNWNFTGLPDCIKGPDDGQCAVGPTNLTYRMFKRKHTGFEAREYCHALGGRLASITDKEEADFIKDWISNFKNEFWIGGSNVYGVDGKFTLEDRVSWYKDWDSIQSIEPNNTCLVLQNGDELPFPKLCNSTNETASILCELSGDHFCPLAIFNDKNGVRIEFYDHRKMPDVNQAASFCDELGGFLRTPEHPTIVEKLKEIYKMDESYTFLSKVTPNVSHCRSADVTSIKVQQKTVACNATNAGTVCLFIDYNLVQGTMANGLRILSNVEDLMYPKGCIEFFGGCYWFVNEPNKTYSQAVQLCNANGGMELLIYHRWQIAFLQLTFNRLQNLRQQNIIVPVNKLCMNFWKDRWYEEYISAATCSTTPTFICEFRWCFDEPLLANRNDVRLLNVTRRTDNSVALYECIEPNAHFDKKNIGDTAALVCNFVVLYKWNVADLPRCVEECTKAPKRDDVTLISTIPGQISRATFNCSKEGMVFPEKAAGELMNISCSLATKYEWDFNRLPNCIHGEESLMFHVLP